MKPVERYLAELDAIKAPASLTEKLYAIPAQYAASDTSDTNKAATILTDATAAPQGSLHATTPKTETAKGNATVGKRIPFIKANPFTAPQFKKFAFTAAACFMVGVFATDALGWQVLPRMGSSGMDSSTTESAPAEPPMVSGAGEMDDIAMNESSANFADMGFADDAAPESTALEYAADSTRNAATATTRKVIYTTDLTLETKNYDDTLVALDDAVTQADGYLSFSEQYDHGSNERSAYFTYRVPATQYQSFLDALAGAGNTSYLSECANDVTTDYLDFQARVTTLTQQRDRLWALQEQAEDLSALLEIETALTNVMYQLESYQGQLNYLADQVDYATITVQLQEVLDYTVTEPSAWDVIVGTVARGMAQFVAIVASVLLFLLSLWVWIILALIGIFVYYGIKRKKANKNS